MAIRNKQGDGGPRRMMVMTARLAGQCRAASLPSPFFILGRAFHIAAFFNHQFSGSLARYALRVFGQFPVLADRRASTIDSLPDTTSTLEHPGELLGEQTQWPIGT
jgi:hypothetical protein